MIEAGNRGGRRQKRGSAVGKHYVTCSITIFSKQAIPLSTPIGILYLVNHRTIKWLPTLSESTKKLEGLGDKTEVETGAGAKRVREELATGAGAGNAGLYDGGASFKVLV
ncbi:hypothetical protein BB558_001679 [Smittium angustum]|uniref:Uncharacterized protein n=1 Tax=Smittium angustum TaxID=133377 RepID=A0A2U1JB47_SMIAN|nr:hypothetical protein BB558_001679 [Smittium angustum]